jgi:hypothetical protein
MKPFVAEKLMLDTTVVAVQSQVSANLDGETIILELDSGVYYGLNRTGAYIWDCLQQPVSINRLCDGLMEVFEVEPELCVQSVMTLLNELLTHRLIEVCNEPGP